MELERITFALLRCVMDGTQLCEETKNLIKPETLPALFKFAKRHDLAHLIGAALEANGLFAENSDTKTYFLRERNMAVYRYEQQRYEFEEVCTVLEKAKIPFLPLKGSVIRQYYAQPWMRTSCDIDILIKEEDLERAELALKTELEYEIGKRGSHDVSLFAPSGVHLELHFSLVETDNRWKTALENVWERRLDGWEYQFAMNEETFYFYHLVHMAVHMRTGGCGIKPFLDLQIIRRNMTIDEEKASALLQEGELTEFERAAVNLSNAWFVGEPLDEVGVALEKFVLHGGVYGNLDNRVAVQQVKEGGKRAYLFSRIFVGFGELSIKYPSLKKRKLLFPFYQVYRWFDLLAHKESRRYTKATIKNTQKTTKEKLQETERLFEQIGL